MDSPDTTAANHMPLQELVSQTLRDLERLGYSKKSLWRYRTVGNRLIAFARENGLEDRYSDQLARHFVDAFGPRNGESTKTVSGWRRYMAFVVKVLGDFSRDGRIVCTRSKIRNVSIPPATKKPLKDYEDYCRDRRHLRPSSVAERIRSIKVFMNFLHARNVQRLDQLRRADLTDFVASRQRFRPRTVAGNVISVRLFLRFLAMRGVLPAYLSHSLPKVRVPRDAVIP